jgi:hypothetical protein
VIDEAAWHAARSVPLELAPPPAEQPPCQK